MATGEVEVLLVVDNEDHIFLTTRVLGEASESRYNIHVVRNGEATLDFVLQRGEHEQAPRPDLILLDIKLPKMDGIEVLRRLKQDPATRAIPVLMLTSSDRDQDVAASYENGANSYIAKPVGFDRFEEKLRGIPAYWNRVSELFPRGGRHLPPA